MYREQGSEYEVPIKVEVPSAAPTVSAPVKGGKEISVKLEHDDVSPSMDSYQGFSTGLASQQMNLPLSPVSPLGFPPVSSAPFPGSAPSMQPNVMVQPPASLIPHTATPEVSNGNLPVFSSTGHIPFAMPFNQADPSQFTHSQFQHQAGFDANYQYPPHDGSMQQQDPNHPAQAYQQHYENSGNA